MPRNPGGCGTWGWIAYETDLFSTTEAYGFGALGTTPEMSNNIAEYKAVISALEWALSAGRLGILIRTDSQLVVHQINGQYRCNKLHLQELRDRAQALLSAVDGRIQWVPRESNEAADKLSRRAYREWQETGSTETTVRVRVPA
jgi:ribonuclease HI